MLVTRVSADSPASDAGLEEGDVIRKVNRIEIDDLDDLDELLGSEPGELVMVIQRGEGSLIVALEGS